VGLRYVAAADQRARLLLRPRGRPREGARPALPPTEAAADAARPKAAAEAHPRRARPPFADGIPNGTGTGLLAAAPPGAWWRFAARALGFFQRPGGWGWAAFLHGFTRRKKYIALRTRQLLLEDATDDKKSDKGDKSNSSSSSSSSSGSGSGGGGGGKADSAAASGLGSGGAGSGGLSDLLAPLSAEESAWLEACHRDRPGASRSDRAVIPTRFWSRF
jgi:hypothetical protein